MKWPPDHVYFVADIGSNHDGDLARALSLIRLCASVGVDAVKFQHFRAPKIVSLRGFGGTPIGHQAAWPRGVYETYEAASLPWEWTPVLAEECARFGMDFLSTPYDLEAIEHLDPFVPAFKIGSGDITYTELVQRAVETGKPILLSTGASTLEDVQRAAALVPQDRLALLQCNSNYTGSADNVGHTNVRVLLRYHELWPGAVLGLSDHSPSYTAVLPAVTLGARIIEKHFTDDPKRVGPDHGFAMDPHIWHDCIERTRECEAALGDGVKRIEANESETYIVQRRCLRAARDVPFGHVLTRDDIDVLRPAPLSVSVTGWYTIAPYDIDRVIGQRVVIPRETGEAICWAHIVDPETDWADIQLARGKALAGGGTRV